MAEIVATNLNLMEALTLQVRLERWEAEAGFPGAPAALGPVRGEPEFFRITIGPRGAVLVARHGTAEDPIWEVWEVWQPLEVASRWARLNRNGGPLGATLPRKA